MNKTLIMGASLAAALLATGAHIDRTMAGETRGVRAAPRPEMRTAARPAPAESSVAAAGPCGALALPQDAPLASNPTVLRWRWLKGTTWYVPAPNLPATLFLAAENRLVPISDQTVYQISDYRDGYFTGKTVVALAAAPAQCLTLVGSVTPEGRVLLTFTPRNASADATVTQGAGQMRRRAGQWAMENQMSSGANALAQVVHWAYMLQTEPGQRSWDSLPGSGLSVPDFLAQCSD